MAFFVLFTVSIVSFPFSLAPLLNRCLPNNHSNVFKLIYNQFEIFLLQIYVRKENNASSLMEGTLLATGGRYDYLLHQLWARDYVG